MPRVPRIYLEGALYYVTSKAIHGQNLFVDKEDYAMYQELLKKNKNQHGFKLYAFCLLPGHVHFLAETKPQTSLSDIMHNITSSYTKYYNKKYGRQGHLFRGRFRATLIEKEPYLLKLIRYIHLNPKQLGLVSDAKEYSYSSYLYYTYYTINPEQAQVFSQGRVEWVDSKLDLRAEINEVIGFLSGVSYEDYMAHASVDEGNRLAKELHRSHFLGSEEFGTRIREKLEEAGVRPPESQGPNRRVAVIVVSGVIAAALSGSLILSAMSRGRKIEKKAEAIPAAATAIKEPVVVKDVPKDVFVEVKLGGLDGTIWQIRFISITPFPSNDFLHFENNQVRSENLEALGYRASGYSMNRTDGPLVWETMQTAEAGTALWYGEVSENRMKGTLSVRPKDGVAQDFSFVSLKSVKIGNR